MCLMMIFYYDGDDEGNDVDGDTDGNDDDEEDDDDDGDDDVGDYDGDDKNQRRQIDGRYRSHDPIRQRHRRG